MHKLIKLARYECNRIIKTKTFLFLTVISLAYSLYVLRTQTLYGSYHTAPYSHWSFISYLQTNMPVLCAITLSILSEQYGKKEKQVQILTLTTQTSYSIQKISKTFALSIVFCINLLLCVTIMYLYFSLTLGHIPSVELFLCLLLIVLPQFLLLVGLGLWIASFKVNAVYILLVVIAFLTFANIYLPMPIDFMGNSILTVPANSIPDAGVIPFRVPTTYLLSRMAFALIGILLITFACRQKREIG